MRWMPRVAVLTFGVAAALTVAAPAVNAGPSLPALNDASALPSGFAEVMGYEPVTAALADGSTRLVNPRGSCSVPGNGEPFDFTVACRAHDFGYDLLRYAHRTGSPMRSSARREIDRRFTRDLHIQCRDEASCDATVAVFQAAVRFNSWRQVSGPPVNDSGLPRTAGLVLLAGVGSFGLLKPFLKRQARQGGSAGSARRGYTPQ